MKKNGLHGQFAQSTSRLQLTPPRPLFNGPMGLLPSISPSTVLIEDVLTGREALAPRKREALTPAMVPWPYQAVVGFVLQKCPWLMAQTSLH
jgi:hypothetical protein